MKANELMIGDWVLDKAVSDKPVQIEQINEQNVHYKRGNGYMSAGVELLEPVPLTEEILMLNFPKPYDIRWCPEDESKDVFCIAWEEPIGLGYSMNIAIRYVHELQHALRLCGIKKEIKIKLEE